MASDDRFTAGAFGELRRNLSDDSLVAVVLPSLTMCLLHMEKKQGRPLTEDEVLDAMEMAPAITMPIEDRDKLYEGRGYGDLDPDNIWPEWQEFRRSVQDGSIK